MTAEAASRLRFRLRLAAACVVLAGLAMAQSPGLLVPDTKFDLAVAPAEFLKRAVHLWDPEGAFGQLQNQAYGYLWPMGPFFLLGSVLDLPGWVIQRLWMALVMCVALVGAARVSRALGVRSDIACLLAGFAYALSPRMLTTLGPISIEAWPSALAPWVLLPLVVGSTSGSARRAAALSALAVAMIGGVNAAAALAALPLGVFWLLTRTPGPRRRIMMVWWPLFTLLGTLWWLIPLFVMGAYSPPFLDYIESASNTTFPTTLFDALRGTSNWVPYVDQQARAGNDLLRLFFLPLNSGVVLLLGVAGVLQRGNPHRLFLALSVVTGLCLVTMGHLGNVQGWGAGELQSLLDGPLAPLRNVHKFDLVVRLPLVIGLAWLVDTVIDSLRERSSAPEFDAATTALRSFNVRLVVTTAVIAVVGASLPAITGRIAPAGGFVGLPVYWVKAADWLGQEGRGTALLVPGSSFGDYVWGAPRDEPMQSLASSPWAVRNAVPLAPPGNIRMLDAVEQRLAQGAPSSGFAAFLRRAGVSHLVVRNDLARSNDIPDTLLVHQAIDGSPGLRRVVSFGPEVGGEAHLPGKGRGRVLVNGGWQNSYPAIEIYAVDGPHTAGVGSADPPIVIGGPEDLLDLADLGLIADEPTVLASDVNGAFEDSASLLLTDGLRAAERHFGRIHDGASATLVPGEERRLGNPTRDYLLDRDDRWSTTARIDGARAVTASSSMADASAYGTLQRGQQPYAAVDGDRGTAWRANYRANEPAWWQLAFDSRRAVEEVTVTSGPDRQEVVRVRTPHRVSEPIVLNPGASRVLRLDDPDAAWVRVEDASGRVGHRLALAEVELPSLNVRRSLVLPRFPAKWGIPDAIVLRAVPDARTGCVLVDRAVRCVRDKRVAAEEPAGFRRRLSLPGSSDFAADLTVRARPGDELDALLTEGLPIGVSASSVDIPDVRASGLAAVDGDPGTAWSASGADLRPALRLNWIGKEKLTGLDLSVAQDTPARLPNLLTLVWPGGRREVKVDRDGEVRFRPIRTDQLTLRVSEADPATSLDFGSGSSSLPVGIGELRVVGLPHLPITLADEDVRFGCGSGPNVTVNGRTLLSAVTASPAELYDGDAVPAKLCSDETLALEAGLNAVDVLASKAFVPVSLVLTNGQVGQSATASVPVDRADPVSRSARPAAPATIFSVKENSNVGWTASRGESALQPAVVDGWQQAWRLGDDAGALRLGFQPDDIYRWGMGGGIVALMLLVAVSLVPRRRWADTPGGPLGPRSVPVPLLMVSTVLAGGVLAGWVGTLLAGVTWVLASILDRRAPDSAPWLFGGFVLPAAVAYALLPWGGSDGWAGDLAWPHYFALVSCLSLLAWSRNTEVRRPRSLRRIPGRSTRR